MGVLEAALSNWQLAIGIQHSAISTQQSALSNQQKTNGRQNMAAFFITIKSSR
jgi:hypothetical protein